MKSRALLIALTVSCSAARSAPGGRFAHDEDGHRRGHPPGHGLARLARRAERPHHDVLRMLSTQFGLSIIAARNVNTPVTARFKDVTLERGSGFARDDQRFAYRVKGGVIEVYQPVVSSSAAEPPRIATFGLKYAMPPRSATSSSHSFSPTPGRGRPPPQTRSSC